MFPLRHHAVFRRIWPIPRQESSIRLLSLVTSASRGLYVRILAYARLG
jgi:hypothetical protein